MIDGGAFYYGVYETQNENEFVAVGAIEPQFTHELVKCLKLDVNDLPGQNDSSKWPEMKELFTKILSQRHETNGLKFVMGRMPARRCIDVDEVKAHQNSIEVTCFTVMTGYQNQRHPSCLCDMKMSI